MRHAGLDAFRLVGAGLVLCAHGAFLLYPLFPIYSVWLGAGWVGTEVFFALSGYLVIGLLLRSPPTSARSAVQFAVGRLRRVMPLFWLFIAINVGVWWWQHETTPERLWAYPLLLQNAWAAHPTFFAEAWNLPPLMFFSVLAPALAMWAMRSANALGRLRNLLLVLAIGGVALRAGWVLMLDPEWDLGVRKWLPTRLDACAWGGLVACWNAGRPSSRGRTFAALLGFLLFVVSMAIFVGIPLTSTVARVGLFVLIGLACALPLPWMSRGCSSAGLMFAARAVFALYLVNMPLIHVSGMVGLVAIGALPAFALWLAVSIGLAGLISRLTAASR